MKNTAARPKAAPMAGSMIAPATAPMPKIEPTQYICADVAAAPLNAPIAVPVEADPKAEMNMSMPPMVAAPVILPVAICATRRARRARRPDTWVIAAIMPFRSCSICRSCFFVLTQLPRSAEGVFLYSTTTTERSEVIQVFLPAQAGMEHFVSKQRVYRSCRSCISQHPSLWAPSRHHRPHPPPTPYRPISRARFVAASSPAAMTRSSPALRIASIPAAVVPA